jgi:hypothetical protein
MVASRQLTSPLAGMPCNNFVAAVEPNLNNMNGLRSSAINQFGFQMGVSENPPGKVGNSPIYWQYLVSWTNRVKTELLKSSSQLVSALGADVVSTNIQKSWSTCIP